MQSMKKDLDVLREICQNTAVPVIGSGHIFRMEDVKKLLYAGCQQVMLDYADPVQLELTKRGLPEIWQRKNRSRRCRYFASGTGKGAAKGIYLQRIFVLSRCNGGGCADVSGSGGNLFAGGFLEKLIEVLSYANISGISGKLVNENITEISAIKALCRENKKFR